MKARIQVGIRLRPFLESEKAKGYANTKIKVDKLQGKISLHDSHSNGNRVFEFDHIFEQSSTQKQIYDDCKVTEMIARVLDGFHSTIFAYGQTGSGKTYTMEGKHDNGNYVSDEMKGIVARAFDDLFTMIATQKAATNKLYNVSCSFLQIYNEKIYDLLSHHSQFAKNADQNSQPSNLQLPPQGLKLRWNAREQFQVENLFVFDIKNPREAQNYFLQGVKNRITASHKLNMTSSRSHTIFTITINTFSSQGAHETTSKLQLVDLAGSERISLTGTEGKMAKESIDINKSLFTLRQVITALSEINQTSGNSTNEFNSTAPLQPQHQQWQQGQQNQNGQIESSDSKFDMLSTQQIDSKNKTQHIPYRESKLTSLLKQSIGGNCYCLMMACIVPNDPFSDENISTLHYASRATYIRNQPVKNEDPNKLILSEVNKENANLKSELEKANAHISFLTAALEKSEKNNAILKQQNGQLASELQNRVAPSVCICQKDEEGKEGIQQLAGQTSTSFQIGGAQQLTKEQYQFQQQQEQFKLQQQSQLQHQKQFEQNIIRLQQNVIASSNHFNQIDPSSASTAFNQAHTIEAARQSQQSQQLQNTFNITQKSGVQFIRNNNNGQDTPTGSSQMRNMSVTAGNNQNLQNQPLSDNKQFYTQLDYDNFSDRLIESITLVRQLLESNKGLRKLIDEQRIKINSCDNELADLTHENSDLREQLDLYLSQNPQLKSSTGRNSKNARRSQNQNQHSSSFDQNDGDENNQYEDNDQYSPQMSNSEGEKASRSSNFGNMPPKYPKKKKTDNTMTDEQDITDIKELVHEENLDTQQADGSIGNLPKPTDNSKAITQPARGKSINSNDGNTYHNQTKNELIQEILELRHNQTLLEKKMKSYDIDKSLVKSLQQGQSSQIQNSNVIASSVVSTTSAGKNQNMTPNAKQNYTFYSSTKKRGASQHQNSRNNSNNNSSQNQQTLPIQMQYQDDFTPSQTLHSTPLTATSLSTTKNIAYLNRTQQDMNNTGGHLPSSTSSQRGNNNNNNQSIDNSSISTTLYANRQGVDSIPTNFGRYTFYQQNFHNLEKLSSQQMVKFQQQQQNQSIASQQQSMQTSQGDNHKFLSTGRNTLSNIGSQQYQDQANETPSNDYNQPNSKRGPASGIPSLKAKRSNSLTKNQINVIQTTPNSQNLKSNQAYEFYQGNAITGIQSGQNSNTNTGITYNKLKNMYATDNNLPSSVITPSNDENLNKYKYATSNDTNQSNKQKQKLVPGQQRKLSITNN